MGDIYASTVYEKKFKGNPLSFEAGNAWREKFLSKGGSVPCSQLLDSLLDGGNPLDPECLFYLKDA